MRAAAIVMAMAVAAHAAENFGDLRNAPGAHTKSHFGSRLYDADEWFARKTAIRRQILVAAGLWPAPRRSPLRMVREKAMEGREWTAERVSFEPLPCYRVAGNLYLPVGRRRPAAAVLIPHGHWKHGRVHDTPDYSVPALGINLARRGYVAFAWDMAGYDDTGQLKHSFGHSDEEKLWAFGPLGVQLWTSMRAVDLVESLPEVDRARIAVTGASGGGTQTFLLAAVDARIAASVPVNMVSAHFQGDDDCEMAPGLRVGTNNVEIAALAAPRPMLLISSTRDWTRNTPSEEYPALRAIYEFYRSVSNVGNRHVDAPHDYNAESRAAAYAFLERHLRRRLRPGVTEEAPPEDLSPLLFPDSSAQERSGFKEIFDDWKHAAVDEAAHLNTPALRDLMRATLGVEWPSKVHVHGAGDRILLERDGSGERIPARSLAGASSRVAVVVDSHGAAHAWQAISPGEHARRGDSVIAIDPYQTGAAAVPRAPLHKDHLVFHHSDDARRVQDIVTAIAWAAKSRKSVELHCDKHSGLWCRAAAAVSRVRVDLTGDGAWEPYGDADLRKLLFVPGIERAGGIAAITRLLQDGRGRSVSE